MDDDDDEQPTRDTTETVQTAPTATTPPTTFFAQNDEAATLADLLQCLNKDQLKLIANQLGISKASSKNVGAVSCSLSRELHTYTFNRDLSLLRAFWITQPRSQRCRGLADH